MIIESSRRFLRPQPSTSFVSVRVQLSAASSVPSVIQLQLVTMLVRTCSQVGSACRRQPLSQARKAGTVFARCALRAPVRRAQPPLRRFASAASGAGDIVVTSVAQAFRHKGVRWITLGWAGFIAENLIMSHNREWIIAEYGKSVYHGVYNTLSTAACGSIAFGFFKHGWGKGPRLWTSPRSAPIHMAAFVLQALGLAGFSQLGPRFQIPVQFVSGEQAAKAAAGREAAAVKPVAGPARKPEGTTRIAVRCPMDFRPRDMPEDGVFGAGRVTRHPTLWSMGFLGLGAALVTPFAAEVAFFGLPVVFALIGGAHQDYRYRRGWGGSLPPEVRGVGVCVLLCCAVA